MFLFHSLNSWRLFSVLIELQDYNLETFVEAIDNQVKETLELDKDGSDEDDEADDNESVNQSKQSAPSEPSSKKNERKKRL